MSETGRICFRKPEGVFEVDFCEPHLNLLAHAQSIELEVGSRCGGHGICGGDRVKFGIAPEQRETLLSRITDDEREHLSEAELADGWRLACQCFPQKAQLSLEVTVR